MTRSDPRLAERAPAAVSATGDDLAFFIDTAPAIETFRDAALAGLSASPKRIAPKFLYDETGSTLFEEITRQPEYYPTRTEIGILTRVVGEIAEAIGPTAAIVELGAGASEKVRLLLDAFEAPAALAAIDISGAHLRAALAPLAQDYPKVAVGGIAADFTRGVQVPPDLFAAARRRLVFLPGSTIGNFTPDTIDAVLAAARGLVRPGDGLLIGVDLIKDPGVLVPAYADAAGVTAAFIKNIITRLAADLGAAIDPADFVYDARWDPAQRRIDMRLIATRAHTLQIAGARVAFARGEVIDVSHSRKFEPAEFHAIAAAQGWSPVETWTDAQNWFGVMLFEAV